jgi:Family of unknown function (DUF5994)
VLNTSEREAAISPAPRAEPRLLLRRDHAGPAPLDGAWWPRSADPAAELPGLILALDNLHGRVTRVMLGAADWNASRPRRLRVSEAGSRVVRLGWFTSMPAGLLTAIYANGQRTDLVTTPPHTSEQDAVAAMEQAARPGNREHALAILAAIAAAAGSTTRKDAESKQLGIWEWEGGHLRDHEATPARSRPVPAGHAPSLLAAGPGSS